MYGDGPAIVVELEEEHGVLWAISRGDKVAGYVVVLQEPVHDVVKGCGVIPVGSGEL